MANFLLLLLLALLPAAAADKDSTDFEATRFEVRAGTWRSHFTGKLTYKPSRKHRIGLEFLPYRNSNSTILTTMVVRQNTTFPAGVVTATRTKIDYLSSSYQWDFISRKQGHAGIGVEARLFRMNTGFSGLASFYEPHVVVSRPVTLKDTTLGAIPLVGPEFRWYPIKGSGRINLNGTLRGMPIAGYVRNFESRINAGLALTHGVGLETGYTVLQDARIGRGTGFSLCLVHTF